MAAGLSKRQIYKRIYDRLQDTKRNLQKNGVGAVYKNRQLFANQNVNPDLEFNIHYRVIGASNGEVAGLIVLKINNPVTETYDHLSFDRGIKRLIEVSRYPYDHITAGEMASGVE